MRIPAKPTAQSKACFHSSRAVGGPEISPVPGVGSIATNSIYVIKCDMQK